MAACEIPELSLKLTRSKKKKKTKDMLCMEICCNFKEVIKTGRSRRGRWPGLTLSKGRVPFCTKAKYYSKSRFKFVYRNWTGAFSEKQQNDHFKNVSNPKRPYKSKVKNSRPAVVTALLAIHHTAHLGRHRSSSSHSIYSNTSNAKLAFLNMHTILLLDQYQIHSQLYILKTSM